MKTTLRKVPHSEFLHPRPELAQCIFGCFVRDTRGCDLPATQRFNHFSASPLCALSVSFEGTTRILFDPCDLDAPMDAAVMPKLMFSGPQDQPTTSWNEDDINAVIIVFYPDAMAALLDIAIDQFRDMSVTLDALPTGPVCEAFENMLLNSDAKTAFEGLQDQLAPLWAKMRPHQNSFGRMISDWSRSLMVNAALSPSGQSLRQMQRRVKSVAGQPLKRLQRFSKAERAFELALREGIVDMAGIATDAGYSDQSHMGRHVRAQTGFTPAELMRRLESDEAFWSYRLIGERY